LRQSEIASSPPENRQQAQQGEGKTGAEKGKYRIILHSLLDHDEGQTPDEGDEKQSGIGKQAWAGHKSEIGGQKSAVGRGERFTVCIRTSQTVTCEFMFWSEMGSHGIMLYVASILTDHLR